MNLKSYTEALAGAEDRAATLGVASVIKYWEPLDSFSDLRIDQDWMTCMNSCRIVASVDHHGVITESDWIKAKLQGGGGMNVLTITPRFLTVAECRQVWEFGFSILCDQNLNDDDVKPLNDQPPIIQEWFDQWCGEASAEYNLHADDDRDELWQKFCEVVGR